MSKPNVEKRLQRKMSGKATSPITEELKKKTRAAKKDSATKDYATSSSAPAPRPRTLETAIGLAIRTRRLENGLSVADLANAADISIGMISKIENGQISPSLGSIQSVAQALNCPISAFFTTFEEDRDCSFVKSGEGVVIERRGSKVGHQYRLLGHVSGGDTVVEPYLIDLTPGAVPFIGFQHVGMEFIYMLKGEIVYRHAGKTYNIKSGDSLLFDSRALHGPDEITSGSAQYLSIIMYCRETR